MKRKLGSTSLSFYCLQEARKVTFWILQSPEIFKRLRMQWKEYLTCLRSCKRRIKFELMLWAGRQPAQVGIIGKNKHRPVPKLQCRPRDRRVYKKKLELKLVNFILT